MAVSQLQSVIENEKKAAPGSPKLSRSAIQTIEHDEFQGIPLNTPWTFWLDKCVFDKSYSKFIWFQYFFYSYAVYDLMLQKLDSWKYLFQNF